MGLIGREEAWFDFFCMRSKYSEELISGKKAMAKGVDPLATTYVKSQSVKLFRFDHKSRQNTPEACTSNDPHPQQGQRIPKQKKMQKLVLLHCSLQSPFRCHQGIFSYSFRTVNIFYALTAPQSKMRIIVVKSASHSDIVLH